MLLKLEARPQPSSFWSYGSPILALLLTVVIGVILEKPARPQYPFDLPTPK